MMTAPREPLRIPETGRERLLGLRPARRRSGSGSNQSAPPLASSLDCRMSSNVKPLP